MFSRLEKEKGSLTNEHDDLVKNLEDLQKYKVEMTGPCHFIIF